MRHIRSVALALGLILVAQGHAAASLLGNTVAATLQVPFGTTLTNFGTAVVADPGVEFIATATGGAGAVTLATMNFSAFQLVIDSFFDVTYLSGAARGFVFTNSNGWGSVSLNAGTTWGAFDASRISVVSNDLRLDFSGLVRPAGSALILDFAFPTTAVPEPASLAPFGGALLGLGALRRRRRA
ncbi:PEP-CTERM sorting domain-containing protein [Falsiroseomonas oryzae]|uniref:PEP-CTERM sorting domain-containing protein n=1 Tax=Falsiroseomonas oryzae TaxID=2766473 RepID=UPI0022EADC47|nr:PEP-CTERM sorting domain-containing protein [Roseomonas sp. MO-31]